MKNKVALALCLVIAQPAHAVNIKKVLGKILKCSWHLTKIGGGIGCWSLCPVMFTAGTLTHNTGNIPDPSNVTPQEMRDTLILLGNTMNTAFDSVLNQRILQEQADLQQELQNIREQYRITQEHVNQAAQWYGNNHTLLRIMATTYNGARVYVRNGSLAYLICFFSAGTASIWSGLTGLGQELSAGNNPESDLSEFEFAK